MTYAIGSFVFGVNLKNVPKKFVDDAEDLVEAGLAESEYSGNGEGPMYVGVSVDGIDEASEMSWSEIVDLKDKLKAAMADNSEERSKFETKISNILTDGEISDEFKEWLKAQKPEVFLTWGTS
jgi:hypothetical protein